MNKLHRIVATVHVVKLHIVFVYQQSSYGMLEIAGKVVSLFNHYAPHLKIEGCLRRVAEYSHFLLEVSELSCIISGSYREGVSTAYGLSWIVYRCASATDPYLVDVQVISFVGKFKLHSYRRLIHHVAAVNNLVLGLYSLCHSVSRRHGKQ